MLMLYMFKSINTIKSISFREILKLNEKQRYHMIPTAKQNYAVARAKLDRTDPSSFRTQCFDTYLLSLWKKELHIHLELFLAGHSTMSIAIPRQDYFVCLCIVGLSKWSKCVDIAESQGSHCEKVKCKHGLR